MSGLRRIASVFLLAVTLVFTGSPLSPLPAGASENAAASDKSARTILFYGCGSDLEDDEAGFLSSNLRQVMNAKIRPDTHIIVMTGGSVTWELEPEYLDGAEQISINAQQRHLLWECFGVDESGNHGKMKLLGTIPEVVTNSMSDPATLQAFIDYGAANYPAEKYDLICWDHGGGPAGGYALDNLDAEQAFMTPGEIVSAVKNSSVVKDTAQKKFDLINFDACMMGNVELVTALAPYTETYVGSAEIEPPYGQEYTTWLNKLYDDPDMDSYMIGKEIVDACYAFYSRTGEQWSGSRATLAVVNTQNFLSRLLPQLKEMAGILQSEALEKSPQNGRYNYYDEMIIARDSIPYGKIGEGLIDLGDFVSRLGVCLTELDNEPDGDSEDLTNRYTRSAVEMVSILNDRDFSGDDVIYSRASESVEKYVDYQLQRGSEGEWLRVSGPVAPSCLSFMLGSSLSGKVLTYVEALNGICGHLDKDDPARGLFDDLKKASLAYAMITETGRVVSSLSSRGKEISYEAVVSELSDDFYNIKDHIDLARTEGLENAEDWLRQIIDQHAGEALREENIAVEATRTTGQNAHNGYYISIGNSSLKTVDSVSLQMTVGFPESENADGMLMLGSFEGSMAQDMMIPGLESGEEPLPAAYRSASCAFEAEEPDPDWYELLYDGGRSVITLRPGEGENGIYAVPVKLLRRDVTDPDLAEYGALEVTNERDGSLTVLRYAEESRTPQPAIPIDNDSLDGARIILTGTVLYDDGFEDETDLSQPIPLTEEPGRGLAITLKPLSQIQGVDAGRISAVGKVKDIYYHEYDITDKLREADKKAEAGEYRTDLASSDVEVSIPAVTDNDAQGTSVTDSEAQGPSITDGSEAQEPPVSVTYGGKTLEQGTDFKVFYFSSGETGGGYVTIFGIGQWCGMRVEGFGEGM